MGLLLYHNVFQPVPLQDTESVYPGIQDAGTKEIVEFHGHTESEWPWNTNYFLKFANRQLQYVLSN